MYKFKVGDKVSIKFVKGSSIEKYAGHIGTVVLVGLMYYLVDLDSLRSCTFREDELETVTQ